MKKSDAEAVILIHGLWMKGFELAYLYFRLWLQGYRVYLFHYSSIFKTPRQNSEKLFKFLRKIEPPVVHFVAHSLGGIVTLHLFEHFHVDKSGKVILLASPVNGSAAARHLINNRFMRLLLGKSVINGLAGNAPEWKYKRDTCVIAGIGGLGLGSMLANKVMGPQHDGTVNLEETTLNQADENHIVKRSHFTLLFSNQVVKHIVSFLKK